MLRNSVKVGVLVSFSKREVFSSFKGSSLDQKQCSPLDNLFRKRNIASVGVLLRVVCTLQSAQSVRIKTTLSIQWDRNSTFATDRDLLQQNMSLCPRLSIELLL